MLPGMGERVNMTDRTCGNCKHWDTIFQERPATGQCLLANTMYQRGAGKHWTAGFHLVGGGILNTSDSHYCNEHEFSQD